MSITVNIYYTGRGNSALEFAREMVESGVVFDVRRESGSEGYEYFVPMFPSNADATVLLIDRWTDQAALDAHHKSPMMARIAALRKKYGLYMRVERYIDERD